MLETENGHAAKTVGASGFWRVGSARALVDGTLRVARLTNRFYSAQFNVNVTLQEQDQEF